MPLNYLMLFRNKTFPATKAELIDHLHSRYISEDVLNTMRALPDDEYRSIEDLNRNILKINQMPARRINMYESAY